jgi:translation elongation factor EF-G
VFVCYALCAVLCCAERRGDNFYDAKRKKWSTERFDAQGKALERGFCFLVLSPLKRLFESILSGNSAAYLPLIQKLPLTTPLSAADLAPTSGSVKPEPSVAKELLKKVLQSWLPAADALLQMIVHHLPSPIVAQKYRVSNLYSGPMDDECATAIRTCDPNVSLFVWLLAFGFGLSCLLLLGADLRAICVWRCVLCVAGSSDGVCVEDDSDRRRLALLRVRPSV